MAAKDGFLKGADTFGVKGDDIMEIKCKQCEAILHFANLREAKGAFVPAPDQENGYYALCEKCIFEPKVIDDNYAAAWESFKRTLRREFDVLQAEWDKTEKGGD